MASENGTPAEQKCCDARAEQAQKEVMLKSMLKSAFDYGRRADISFETWLELSGALKRGILS